MLYCRVPNAIVGRDSVDIKICGMQGVPLDLVLERAKLSMPNTVTDVSSPDPTIPISSDISNHPLPVPTSMFSTHEITHPSHPNTGTPIDYQVQSTSVSLDDILIYNDDLVSMEEKRAAQPRYASKII